MNTQKIKTDNPSHLQTRVKWYSMHLPGYAEVELLVLLRMPRPKNSAMTLKPSALFFSCVKNLSCGRARKHKSRASVNIYDSWDSLSPSAPDMCTLTAADTSYCGGTYSFRE